MSIAIPDDEALFMKLASVDLNPLAARIVKPPEESRHTFIRGHIGHCGGHGSLAQVIGLFFVKMLPEVSYDNQKGDEVVGGVSCDRNQEIGGRIHHQ